MLLIIGAFIIIKQRNMDNSTQRIRRTNLEVSRDLLDATASLIKEIGFSKITLAAIAQRANLNLSVIYRNYTNLDKLLEQYTHKFDFWLNDILDVEELKDNTDEYEIIDHIAAKFVKLLAKDKEMQKLMIWELGEDNKSTKRSAQLRDIAVAKVIPLYEKQLSHLDINPRAVLAIIVAGMYFLILRGNRSTFASIDFSTKQGKQLLSETMAKIFKYLSMYKEQDTTTTNIAKKLKKAGVQKEIIIDSTGISKEQYDII